MNSQQANALPSRGAILGTCPIYHVFRRIEPQFWTAVNTIADSSNHWHNSVYFPSLRLLPWLVPKKASRSDFLLFRQFQNTF